ncbi:hypothetical protein [Microbacterium allomyrinae]|jgi:hypothetical protein|uniref:Uncharacterized protein n=1 Tax=Microbacterium allomyrinae TaxID=2830666 RepID=A0A9X1LUH4_9MICO|nr:hypothetical protein [Microbacterium allomyrinae]MCC2032284.1 hypothetical protein [Microbacterium allomyrinae]
MTAIATQYVSAPGSRARVTPFERTLLRTASALDAFVVTRLERRTGAVGRQALTVQAAFALARRDAEARGVMGMIPR